MIVKLDFLTPPSKYHSDVVKLKVCTIADVGALKYILAFLLAMAGHMTPRRGPDMTSGPDVVHH